MKENNLGFDVVIQYKVDSPFGAVKETRHNVTEIHYAFDGITGRDSVAFESNIHGTGGNVKIDYIKEFEAKLATKLSENY